MSITSPAIVLGLLSLILVAVLARTFFLPGKWNGQWWANTAPFVVCGITMVGVLLGLVTPAVEPSEPLAGVMAILAVVLMTGSAGLVGYTLGTHRRRLALWYQTDDAPEHLVTEGAYTRIRHPFYTSYLVSLLGCVLAAPHYTTLLVFVFVLYRLNGTAQREEARFLASDSFALDYARYVERTGRFVPPLFAQRETAPGQRRSTSGYRPSTTVSTP